MEYLVAYFTLIQWATFNMVWKGTTRGHFFTSEMKKLTLLFLDIRKLKTTFLRCNCLKIKIENQNWNPNLRSGTVIQAILKLGLITTTCWILQTGTVLGAHDVIKRVSYNKMFQAWISSIRAIHYAKQAMYLIVYTKWKICDFENCLFAYIKKLADNLSYDKAFKSCI